MLKIRAYVPLVLSGKGLLVDEARFGLSGDVLRGADNMELPGKGFSVSDISWCE